MISIIVIFCDKDTKFLSQYIAYFKKLTFERELILVDNREKDTSSIDEYNCYKIVSMHKNLGCAAGRKLGFDNSNGDYVWFNDIDDVPFDIDSSTIEKLYKIKPDIFRGKDMPFFTVQEKLIEKFDKKEAMKNTLLWNKIFKRELLEKAFKNISYSDMIVLYEDIYISYFIMYYANSYFLSNSFIYYYNNSYSECSRINPTLEQFTRLAHGYKIITHLSEFDKNYSSLVDLEEKKDEFYNAIKQKYDNVKKEHKDIKSLEFYLNQ